MTWVKIDDSFMEHPKWAPIADDPRLWTDCIVMWMAGICYANKHQTDGVLPVSRPKTFGTFTVRRANTCTETLVKLGFWERCEQGFLIHDYLEHQSSRAEIQAKKEQARARMQKHRAECSQNVRANNERSFARSSRARNRSRNRSPLTPHEKTKPEAPTDLGKLLSEWGWAVVVSRSQSERFIPYRDCPREMLDEARRITDEADPRVKFNYWLTVLDSLMAEKWMPPKDPSAPDDQTQEYQRVRQLFIDQYLDPPTRRVWDEHLQGLSDQETLDTVRSWDEVTHAAK